MKAKWIKTIKRRCTYLVFVNSIMATFKYIYFYINIIIKWVRSRKICVYRGFNIDVCKSEDGAWLYMT